MIQSGYQVKTVVALNGEVADPRGIGWFAVVRANALCFDGN